MAVRLAGDLRGQAERDAVTFPPIAYLGLAAAAVVAAIAALVWWYRGRSRKHALIELPTSATEDIATLEGVEPLGALNEWATFAPPMETPPAAAPAISAASEPPRPTRVSFYLHLPTQGQARSAGQIARREGYAADVRPPVQGDGHWLCVLTRELIATPEAVQEERAYLEELAAGLGGSVDRWEAAP